MATIYEVSKLAGVSLATVSRVMNGNSKVRPATKEKVLAAIKELDYRPSSAAQSLASSQSNSVGILVSELHGPYFGSMMSEIEATLRAAGKHVIIIPGHSDKEAEKDAIKFLLDRDCDALILHVEALSDTEVLDLSAKSKALFIYINRLIDTAEDRSIILNNRLGGYLATQHLTSRGHKNIGYISGPLWKADATDRLAGHMKALSEIGIHDHDTHMVEGTFREESGFESMQKLLADFPEMTATVCGNDEMAAGAMRAIREAGLSIPDDISLVGFDNIIFTRFMFPTLTTLHAPIGDMGKMAAQMVLRDYYKIDQDQSIQLQFDPHLVQRNSVRDL